MPDTPRSAFSSLYTATFVPLRRYLARMLGNSIDAQDIAHDAYTRVYEAMHLKWVEHPKAYLFTTARRLALNQLHRQKHKAHSGSDSSNIIEFTPAESAGVERIVMAREEWQRLEAAIERLPNGCRQVLLMCKVDRLSHAEISATLGIAVSTIEKQHARALRLLRQALNEPFVISNTAESHEKSASQKP